MSFNAPVYIVPLMSDGTSTTMTVPDDIVAALDLRAATLMQITATEDAITVRPCDSAIQRQLEIAREVMRDRQNVLRRLAE